MFNYKSILIQLVGTLLLIVAAFFCGEHRQSVVDNVKAQQAIISNQTKVISQMELISQNNYDVITKLNTTLDEENSKYTAIIEGLNNDKKTLTNKLNSTNRINGLLVRTIQLGVSGNSMPESSITAGGAYGYTTQYNPARFTASVIRMSKDCNSIRTNYIALQNYIKKDVEIRNK